MRPRQVVVTAQYRHEYRTSRAVASMRTCGVEYSIAALLALARRGHHPAATTRAVCLVPQPARHCSVRGYPARTARYRWLDIALSLSQLLLRAAAGVAALLGGLGT